VKPGQDFKIECYDWTGGFIKNDESAADVRDIDLSIVHFLSGPVGVEGAEPGDALAVHIESMKPRGENPCGTCCMIPYFGALTGTTYTATLNPPLPELTRKIHVDEKQVRWSTRVTLPYSPHIGTLSTSPEIDSINSLTPDMVVTLAKDRGLAAVQEPGTTMAYLAFNFEDPILAKREVRQALAYATDRATIIKHLLRGQARPAQSLLPPNHWAFDGDVQKYDFDPGLAERMLDAAGYPRGTDGVRLRLTLKTSTDEFTRLTSAAIADEWKRVGVNLELRPLEFATFYTDITRGSFQMYTLRWVGANTDPDIFEYVFGSKRMPPVGANRGHYRNAELDLLLDRARVEMDQAKRKEILARVQEIVAADEPYINLWYVDNVCVHRDRLEGITLSPGGDYDFLDAAFLK